MKMTLQYTSELRVIELVFRGILHATGNIRGTGAHVNQMWAVS